MEKSAEIVEDSAPGCAYYTNPEAFAQLQRMAAEQARRQTEEVNRRPGPKDDNLGALLKDANQMEGIVKTLGSTQPVKDGRVFSFTVQRDFGQDSWSGSASDGVGRARLRRGVRGGRPRDDWGVRPRILSC